MTGPDPDASRPDLDSVEAVEVLVRDFYRDAAMDELLGPVFEAADVNWDAHVATLIDFWSWQLLGIPGYTGNPLRAHEPAHRETPFTLAHHQRWIELFEDTVDARFEGPGAAVAVQRARKMNHALARLLHGVTDDADQSGDVDVTPILRRDGSGGDPPRSAPTR